MKLYLASNNLGNFTDRLCELVGSNKKALVISNARDYKSNDRINSDMAEKLKILKGSGFDSERLDLKPYFGKQKQLRNFIKDYNPGLIYAIGGNVFILRTAMKLSGLDGILLDMLKKDQVVYAGNSAGSMVCVKNLQYYGHKGLDATQVQLVYNVKPEMNGLGLIDSFIVPHANEEKHRDSTNLYIGRLEKAHQKITILNDADVLVLDGDKIEILRGRGDQT